MDVAGVSIDLAAVTTAQKVVLVEGGSDKAAVEVLAGRRGQVLGGAGIHVVAMGVPPASATSWLCSARMDQRQARWLV